MGWNIVSKWLYLSYPLQAAGYLAIENIYHQNASEEGSCEESISRDEEPFDEATLVSSNKNDMHIYDYHILYSFTFRVPVLYFRGYQSDGCPLKLVDIEKDLPAYSLKLLRESKWAFITQEDHPYLHRPWYTLHPCGTGDWMKFLLCSDAPNKIPALHGYLSAWLSVIGQVVGLRIPIGLFKSV
ncbi:ubiquitin-like-conjugating enzyme ATG10 isoform X2 [Zingiber officinale]|uniref:ubiquitin-like-conjugating enzyme ATG10 isoform X2 n=1 Tax=Zingiber officinale TaxID=94328 RepID=UPI001C4CF951|nr:ubiquitin-like-conjugating enzyme ATG10 isoform X2 [Zingiber officinale]XP_042412705.1 ubiquitin-like-conjugating enzyme ATG10 isoform X2 [Zingiber officinale]XP_042412706.1 ubiquitin-like-conjugating enzyme ATG10 isoform X2 [Zingiber officinale]XP_042412707.1 ubiquitin-like-conjugating enzyme ATG10 isoform X2 [Zingiber officinale]